eukprot:scaffold33859_cov60-Attheya_sp.AAC.5
MSRPRARHAGNEAARGISISSPSCKKLLYWLLSLSVLWALIINLGAGSSALFDVVGMQQQQQAEDHTHATPNLETTILGLRNSTAHQLQTTKILNGGIINKTMAPDTTTNGGNSSLERNKRMAARSVSLQGATCGAHAIQADPITLPQDVEGSRPPWCLDIPKVDSGPHFLGMILHVRIYAYDKPKLSHLDLAHWLTYHRYAGVEKVYLFDTYLNESEKLTNNAHIRASIQSGFVHYTDFHDVAMADATRPGGRQHLTKVQTPSYTVAQELAVNETRWCAFTDMDEYPFVNSLNDTRPGFFARFIAKKERAMNCITHFQMKNFLVEGGRGDFSKGPMLIQQIPRLDKIESNRLRKQIVRLDAAKEHGVHGSNVNFGNKHVLDEKGIMMKHFWGGRKLDWRRVDELSDEEREKLYGHTTSNDMGGIPEQVLRCF